MKMINEAIELQKIEIKLQQKLAEKARKAKAKSEKNDKKKGRKTLTDPSLPGQIKLLNEETKMDESSDSS